MILEVGGNIMVSCAFWTMENIDSASIGIEDVALNAHGWTIGGAVDAINDSMIEAQSAFDNGYEIVMYFELFGIEMQLDALNEWMAA